MPKLFSIAAGIAIAAFSLAGFSAQQERLSFEVASIKPRAFAPGLLGVEFHPGGRMTADQAPLVMLIIAAYNILPEQITGMPRSFSGGNAYYDIEAKAEATAIPPGPLNRESRRKCRG